MRRTLVLLVLSVALLAMACAAFAQNAPAPAPNSAPPAIAPPLGPGTPPPGQRPGVARTAPCIVPTLRMISPQMMPMLSTRLSLTEDQKTKVLDLLTKLDNDTKPKIEAHTKLAREYAELLIKTDATQADVLAAADKTMKAEGEILSAKIQALFAIKALLTADQSKLLADYMDQYTRPWREPRTVPGSVTPNFVPGQPTPVPAPARPTPAPKTAPAPAPAK